MIRVIILLCFIFNTFLCASCQFLGADPVRFEIHEVSNCEPDSPWVWTQDVRILNASHAIASVNATIDKPFDNSISISGELQQWSNNKWKNIIKMTKKKACATLKQYGGSIFNEVCKELGMKTAACPIPTGTYFVKEKVLDYSQSSLSKFMTGKFHGKVFATDPAKVVLFCVDFVASAIKING